MHISPTRGRSRSLHWQTACLVLLTASPLLAAESGATFLVTSDSHYDAFENEDRNERGRVTIDQIRLIASAREIELHTGASPARVYLMWDRQGSAHAALREFLDRSLYGATALHRP